MSNSITDPKLLELPPDDTKRIGYMEKNNPVSKFLRHEAELQFSIGDVLVKLEKKRPKEDGTEVWEPKTIQHGSPIVRRYVVVYKSPEGIPFLRSINANGSPGTNITCVADLDLDHYKFQLDSEYVDHMLLADDGDHLKLGGDYKEFDKKRREVYKHNKKLLKPFRTVALANEFLENLKVGDRFYYQSNYNYSPNKSDEYLYEVASKSTVPLSSIYFGYSGYGTNNNNDAKKAKLGALSTIHVVKIKQVKSSSGGYNSNHELRADNISGECGTTYVRISTVPIQGVMDETL